ncbi:MAG: hypothetical protein HUJ76_01790 [Parasporobacterium sp.]|nr:hypothetical protein [Parasporobacterium sp.]
MFNNKNRQTVNQNNNINDSNSSSNNSSSYYEVQNRFKIRMAIRGVAILYLGYLMYSLIAAYRRGDPGIELWQVICVAAIFVLFAGLIIILSVRQKKRIDAKYCSSASQHDNGENADDGSENSSVYEGCDKETE